MTLVETIAFTISIIILLKLVLLYTHKNQMISLAKTLVNGKEVDVEVSTGISDDTNTVIISGLTEGQAVITGTVSKTTTSASTGTSVFSSGLRGVGGGGR